MRFGVKLLTWEDRRRMIVNSRDRVGLDDANALDWRELAAKRLAGLAECEQSRGELQQQVERLRQEHYRLQVALHAHEQALASCNEELSRLRLIEKSWGADVWRAGQWVRKPANWFRWLAGNRALRRLMALRSG
jgi:hypothetical protein